MCKLLGCAFVVFSFLSCSILVGQTVDTSILGSVTDPQGSVIVGATVVVRADATGQKKSVETTGDGQYRVQYLVPGIYTVTVNASGFSQTTRSGIQLALSQQIHLDVAMSLSGTQQTVDVNATQPLLQSENAALGTTVDTNRTVNLPLNGRKFNDLAVLTPGVRVSNPDNHSSSTAGSTIAANSGRADWGAVLVDGVCEQLPLGGCDRGVSRADGELLGRVWLFGGKQHQRAAEERNERVSRQRVRVHPQRCSGCAQLLPRRTAQEERAEAEPVW